VKSTPSLHHHNWFSVLSVDTNSEIDEPVETIQVVQPPKKPRVRSSFQHRWKRSLPAKLIISSVEENAPKSLQLKVSIETTDTGKVNSLQSLIDSGRFIDRGYVKTNQLTTQTLSTPIPVFNVDGTPNEAGSITEVVDLILRYKNHLERFLFAVASLGRQNLILGLPWLQKHNPEIDWVTSEVKMSRCSARCCSGCRDEIREERKAENLQARCIAWCSASTFPALVEDEEDEEQTGNRFNLEGGDRLFAMGLQHLVEEIQVSSTISQQLAEALRKNSEHQTGHDRHRA
jgi:hypothetical protein